MYAKEALLAETLTPLTLHQSEGILHALLLSLPSCIKLFTLTLFLSCSLLSASESRIQQTSFDASTLEQTPRLNLASHFSYLIAPHIEDYTQALESDDWQASSQATFDNFQQGVWIKASISNPSPIPRRLLFIQGNPRIDLFKVYIANAENQLIEQFTLGRLLPFSERPIQHRRFTIPITINPGETIQFIYAGNAGSLDLLSHTDLWDADYYYTHDHGGDLWDMFYLGAIFALALYNLFIFSITREKAYLYYSCFVFSTLSMFVCLQGWAFQYLWPNNLSLNQKPINLSISAMVFWSGIFTIEFLHLNKVLPFFSRAIRILCYCLAALACLVIIVPRDPDYIFIQLIASISIPVYLLCWFSGLLSLYKTHSYESKIYSIAWSLLIFATLTAFIHETIQPLFDIHTFFFLQASHLIEMILLSMALASYITDLKVKENVSRAKSEASTKFLSRMSHEIRTPMNGILGMSDLLLKEEDIKSHHHAIDVIHNSALSLEKIINDILDYSKLEAGKVSLTPVNCNIKKLIREVTDLFYLDCEHKGIAIQVNIDEAIPEQVTLDPLRLKQILINLFANAVKFTSSGHIQISARLNHHKPDKELLFCVADTGQGIAKQDQRRLFDPFEQASNNNLGRESSTGLGLAICRDLVELMGGRISIQSTLNVGSSFEFNIGFTDETPENTITQAPEQQLLWSNSNILVAEDNLTNQLVIEGMLKKLDANITIANNGEEAVKAFEDNTENRFDFILMDCEMPLMNGFEATRAIREIETQRRQAPCTIIAITAHTLHEELEACFSSGMDSLLLKPITLTKLVDALSNAKHIENSKVSTKALQLQQP